MLRLSNFLFRWQLKVILVSVKRGAGSEYKCTPLFRFEFMRNFLSPHNFVLLCVALSYKIPTKQVCGNFDKIYIRVPYLFYFPLNLCIPYAA